MQALFAVMTYPPKTPGKITIISQHFAPSTGATAQLITDLSYGLALKGHHIKVLTSTPSFEEPSSDIQVVRSPYSRREKSTILSKLLNGVGFAAWSVYELTRTSKPNEVILIISNPPFIGIVGLLARLLRGAKYIFVLQDLFPRSAELTGVLPAKGPLRNIWSLIIQTVCQYSYRTIVLSHAMRLRCLKDFKLQPQQLTVIHNWAVEKALPLAKKQNPIACEWKVDDLFTIQYSGNFGRLHEIITLLEAARIVAAEPIHFLFVGGGAKRSQICAYINYYNLKNVTLHPYQDRSVLPYSLGACDVSAIGLIPGSEDTVAPSKFYGIISSGKPVLLLARHTTDIAHLINENECGIVLDPGDPLGVANSLRDLSRNPEKLRRLATNAQKTYIEQFGKDKSIEDYHQLILDSIHESA